MGTRHDYNRQAQTYDSTRGASPSIVEPLVAALGDAHRVLDVGGGTGNYALALRERGFDVTVLDYNAAMLEHAAAKGVPTIQGDAAELPFLNDSWDAVTMVAMLHHVPDWRAALSEARRVAKLVLLVGWGAEHIAEVTWVADYFPSPTDYMVEGHPPLDDLLAELPGAEVRPVLIEDTDDLNLSTLQRHPELILDPTIRSQTSYFERLASGFPDELEAGLGRLQADLESGVDPRARVAAARERIGDAALLVYRRP